jgi:hypothetical protein
MSKSFDTLAEPFKSKVEGLDRKLKEENLPLTIFETRRDFKRQAELFGKGRTLVEGLMKVTEPEKVVTMARAGVSAHNWGLAADFVLDVNHKYWDSWVDKPANPWDSGYSTGKPPKPSVIAVWHKFGELVAWCDLEWGGSWKFKDLPHVEVKNWKSYRPSNWVEIVEREMKR